MLIYILAGIILAGGVFSLDQLVTRMYRSSKEPHHETPGDHGIAYEEIRIPLPGDAFLYGWWIPASPDAPTIFLVHGWGRNLSRMLPYIVHLHPLGCNLLAFDARNHGSSSPEKHATVWTFTEDTLAAMDYIGKSGRVSTNQFGIAGLSIGGGAAINAASLSQRVKCAVTVGSFSHPVELMKTEIRKRNYPAFLPGLMAGYVKPRFGIDFNKIAPVNNIDKAEAQILLIHGQEDTTVPFTQGLQLKASAHAEKTNLWIVAGKGHSDCETHPEFWGRVSDFFGQHLPGG